MYGRLQNVVTLGAALFGAAVPAWAGDRTALVSVNPGGQQGNSASGGYHLGLSDDGRFVAFASIATNLLDPVGHDTNNSNDVFVRDRARNRTERVSVNSAGEQAIPPDGPTGTDSPYISADGRYVAFDFGAANLVAGDTNGVIDIFVRDRRTGTTERVNGRFDGTQTLANSYVSGLSAGGRYVLFASGDPLIVPGDTNGAFDVFVRDRCLNRTERVSVASKRVQSSGGISGSSMSTTGRFVVFGTPAKLVDNDTNGTDDVYLHDRKTNTTERVSVASGGVEAHGYSQGGSVSADGHYVTFESDAPDLVAGDTNENYDIFVHDRQTLVTKRVSVTSRGAEAHGFSYFESISADGRFVTFTSSATDLVPGDTNNVDDIFVHDRKTGTTRRVSGGQGSAQANGSFSQVSSLSADGRLVVFGSDATNLVPGGTNGQAHVFIRQLR
jgi:hypothetical protein